MPYSYTIFDIISYIQYNMIYYIDICIYIIMMGTISINMWQVLDCSPWAAVGSLELLWAPLGPSWAPPWALVGHGKTLGRLPTTASLCLLCETACDDCCVTQKTDEWCVTPRTTSAV